MRVALDISSLTSPHKYRGLGFYTKRLADSLEKLQSKNFKLIKFSKKLPRNFDLVHYPSFTLFHPKLVVPQNSIFTVHDLIPLKFPQHFPLGLRARLAWFHQKNNLKKAKAIITDSMASQKDINKFTGIKKTSLKVIYLAADTVFKPVKDKYWLKKIKTRYQLPSKFVLYVGDLNYNKNMPLLTKACLELKLPLVVVGQQAMADDYNKRHIETQNLTAFQSLAKQNPDLIIRLGFVPTKDLVAIYNLATCYTQPSLAEGFGLPILEAFQSGCPVITSKNTSTAEIAEKAAILINPRSLKEIKIAIKTYFKNKNLRLKYTKLGLNQVKKFSWEKTTKHTLKVYEKTYSSQN